MARKSNWDFLKKQRTEEKTGFRNVHENQHLERKQLGEMRSSIPITIGSVFLGIFVFLMIWIPLSFLNPPVSPEDAVGDVKPGIEVPSDMPSSYFVKETDYETTPNGRQEVDVYYEVDQNGDIIEEPSYSSPSDIDPPDWYTQYYDVDVDDLGIAIVYPNVYFTTSTDYDASAEGTVKTIEYRAVDEQGEVIDEPVYYSEEDVPVPDWWNDALAQQAESGEGSDSSSSDESQSGNSSSSYDVNEHGSARDDSLFGGASSFAILFHFTLGKFIVSFAGGLLAGVILYGVLRRQLDAENLMYDVTDINQHENDQHVMLVEELLDNFDVFPDAGFESGVNVTAMISHIHLDNSGLKNVYVSKRYDKDVLDEDGDIEYHKGEVIYDDHDDIIFESKPVFDTEFSEALFDASGAPEDNDKLYRKKYNPSKIPYNPDGKNRDKLGKYDTVADLINKEWEIPWYEVQRPAGVYIVDTTPSNTLVVAMTRAGKGRETRSLVKSWCTHNLFMWRTNISTNLTFAMISDMIIL